MHSKQADGSSSSLSNRNIKWWHNTFLDLTKTAQTAGRASHTEARSISKPFKHEPVPVQPLWDRATDASKLKKRSSSHQLTLLSISGFLLEPRRGKACTRGHRFWKITRNSFPPWMENNKGIPHDRPLFLSSAGHKSTDLLIETPSSFRLYHNQTAELSSGDLINKLQAGRKSVRSLGKVKTVGEIVHSVVFGRKMQEYTSLNIQFDYSLLSSRFLT